MSDKPTRWNYVTTAIIAVLCGCWVVYDIISDPEKIPFEPVIAFVTGAFAIWGYSRWKGKGEVATAITTQNAEKIYNIETIQTATFSVSVKVGMSIFLVALFVIGIWQKNEIKEMLGFNRFFEANDSDFKILVLPFKQMCTQDGKSYDAGFVVNERLNSIIHKEKLQIKTHYWANYNFKDFNDETAKNLREYHHADMILFGSYQTDACSGDGNQVCINYITDEKWKMGETGINLSRDYQRGGMDELKTGKLQEKIESLATLISLIAQVKSIDHETYVERLKEALNDDNLGKRAQAAIYLEIADKLREEGRLQELLIYYGKALKIYEACNEKYNIALCYERLGSTHGSLGDLENALGFFEQSNQLEKELFAAYPKNVNFKNVLTISYEKLGLTHSRLGDLKKALGFFEQSNRLEKELYSAYPQNVEFKNGLAISYSKLGETHSSLGNLDKALVFFEVYNRLEKELYSAYPANVSFKNGLAISYQNLGQMHSRLGNLDKALVFFGVYSRLEKELNAAYPTNVDLKNNMAISYQYLGITYSSLGDLDKALVFFEVYSRLEKELNAAYPTNVDFKNNMAISYSKLGETHSSLGNSNKALGFFEQMAILFEELYVAHPTNVEFKNGLAISYSKLGETHRGLGNLDKALRFFEEYNRLEKELYAANPMNVSFINGLAISYSNLGDTYSNLGNLDKALGFFEQSNRLEKELYFAYPQNVEFKNGLAISYAQLGIFSRDELKDKSEAKVYFQEAEELWLELVRDAPRYVDYQESLEQVQGDLKGLGGE